MVLLESWWYPIFAVYPSDNKMVKLTAWISSAIRSIWPCAEGVTCFLFFFYKLLFFLFSSCITFDSQKHRDVIIFLLCRSGENRSFFLCWLVVLLQLWLWWNHFFRRLPIRQNGGEKCDRWITAVVSLILNWTVFSPQESIEEKMSAY